MPAKLTREEFIAQCKSQHGGKYDYSDVLYTKSTAKIKIFCNTCKEYFIQQAIQHKRGSNCPTCVNKAKSTYKRPHRLTTEIFIERARKKHGTTYDYSKTDYIDSTKKVTIICPKHGEFSQATHSHLSGNGCPTCGNESIGAKLRYTKEQFISRAKAKHGTQFNYHKVDYTGAQTNVTIYCNQHKVYFEQTPETHLAGGGCKQCRYEKAATATTWSTEKFIERAKKEHGNKYSYTKTKYTKSQNKVTITCKIHGDFEQLANTHVRGGGCPECGRTQNELAKWSTTEEFTEKATKVHAGKYDYTLSDYVGAHTKITIICPDHGKFKQTPGNHIHTTHPHGCPSCVSQVSKGERELIDWLESTGKTVTQPKKSIISPFEIDIYLPEHKLGIEFNGLYYHSDSKGRGGVYHKNKTKLAEKKGIHLMQFWDIEWDKKQDIVKSIILNKLNLPQQKYFARKLQVQKVTTKAARAFCDENHIHGFRAASVYLGLWDGVELVALMSAAKDGEMVRFVVKKFTQVVGGFSRLLKYCPITYSFVDRRIFQGDGYKAFGFTSEKWTYPNYFYTSDYKTLEARQTYQKHKLHKHLEDFDPALSEVINMRRHGFDRIFDCGHVKFILDNID